jgi:predicted RND superfamily exporter protein
MLDSAILLSLGFGLFAFSRFYPTQVFGAVSALVFVVGILGELTFFQQVLDRFNRTN